ncbi:MAG: hypothetical protein DCF29_09545 [Alphaproteobacteria bacterium]|nr:MAG: hypothetical protein DCF29_09545 [Alphaproteobacteria bacterium]
MSITAIGSRPVVASGSFIVPLGATDAILSLPGAQVSIKLQAGATTDIRTTGPSAAEIRFQNLTHTQAAYLDGNIGAMNFAITAVATSIGDRTYFTVTYSVTG